MPEEDALRLRMNRLRWRNIMKSQGWNTRANLYWLNCGFVALCLVSARRVAGHRGENFDCLPDSPRDC